MVITSFVNSVDKRRGQALKSLFFHSLKKGTGRKVTLLAVGQQQPKYQNGR